MRSEDGTQVTPSSAELHSQLLAERRARALVEQKLLVTEHFLSSVTHDLRTPLHAILGWIQLLRAPHLAESEQISAVVSDLSLKEESGLELMRELRKRSVVPGIALSGYSDPEHRSESEAAGFAEHLSKPVDLEILLESIRRVTASALGEAGSSTI